MKIVIFSDNHRDVESVKWVVATNPDADRIISLGDSEMREHELTNYGVFGVKGNYPFEPDFPFDLVMEFEGWRVLMTHGHRYFVKSGMSALYREAKSRNCQVALFGHTHQAVIHNDFDVLLINPGSTASPKNGLHKTYGILYFTTNALTVEIREIETNTLLQKLIEPAKKAGEFDGFGY